MNRMQRIEGSHTALVTPFKNSRRGPVVDYDALAGLVAEQVHTRVGIVLLGTTGESPTVHDWERRVMTQRVVAQVNGAVPVTVGTGTNDTHHSIQLTRMAAEQGANAVLAVNPYYNKPPQRGMQAHFEALANSTDAPVILYDIPCRSSVGLETDTIRRLADHPNIIGVKWANGNIEQLQQLVADGRDDFSIVSGDDNRTLEAMRNGAVGVISVLSNLFPDEIYSMVQHMLSGETQQAEAIHNRLLPFMHGCFVETNPIPIKAALAFRQKIKNVLRLPLVPMRDDLRAEWERLLRTHSSFSSQHS